MKQRGLGDYRIPKTMLTKTDGSRIPVGDIIDHRGLLKQLLPYNLFLIDERKIVSFYNFFGKNYFFNC